MSNSHSSLNGSRDSRDDSFSREGSLSRDSFESGDETSPLSQRRGD